MSSRIVAKSIDEYIAAFSPKTRKVLKDIRATIRKAAPQAVESISYGIPTYKMNGRPLVYFAAHTAHVGMYPMTGGERVKFEKELSKYEQGKGTVRFPLDERMPLALIGRIVRFKVKENAGKTRPKTRARRTEG